jgi:hypothetical protein
MDGRCVWYLMLFVHAQYGLTVVGRYDMMQGSAELWWGHTHLISQWLSIQ